MTIAFGAAGAVADTERADADARKFRLGILIVWIVSALLLALLKKDAIFSGELHGPDDYLRLQEVRDFLAGQNWRDVTQYRLNPPDGAPMHWSRLVDLPLALVMVAFRPLVGAAGAETAAAIIVPCLSLFLTIMLIAFLIRRVADWRMALIGALLVPGMMFPALQLSPMRIDHHGWQIVLGLAAVAAIAGTRTTRAAMLGGVALALMLHISLEGLPLAVAAGALLALRALFVPAETGRLLSFMISLMIASLAFFAATQPVAMWSAHWCDAIMPAYLAALAGATAGLSLLMLPAANGRARRLGILAVSTVMGIGCLSLINPACLAGPFSALDPVVKTNWYVNVREGMPLWQIVDAVSVASGVAMLIGVAATLFMLAEGGWQRRVRLDLAFLFVAAALSGIFVLRSIALAQLLSLPALIFAFSELLRRARLQPLLPRLVGTIGLLLLLLPATPLFAMDLWESWSSKGEGETTQQSGGAEAACFKKGAWTQVADMPPTTMLTPLDPTPAILAGTPHRMLASGHHRNEAAMKEVIEVFRGSPADARIFVREKGLSHIAWCAGAREMRFYARQAPNGFAAALNDGEIPAWMHPIITGPGKAGVRLYRVAP